MGDTTNYRAQQHLGPVDTVAKFLEVVNEKLDGEPSAYFEATADKIGH